MSRMRTVSVTLCPPGPRERQRFSARPAGAPSAALRVSELPEGYQSAIEIPPGSSRRLAMIEEAPSLCDYYLDRDRD